MYLINVYAPTEDKRKR